MEQEKMRVSLAELLPVMEEQLAAGKAVRFGPKGISMLPMLRQGRDSVVLQKPPAKLKKYDLPLYRRPDGAFVLHRVVGEDHRGYITCGDNQTFREYGVTHKQVIGIVTGYYRDEEYISCDNPQYKRYCRRRVCAQYWRGRVLWVKRQIRKLIPKQPEGEQK